jgi:tRNA1(Val) A37 N6-methylase TrmN6
MEPQINIVEAHQLNKLTLNTNNLAPFYTPSCVAQILTDWAIVDTKSTILDPSYGGCSFLNAALTTLQQKGHLRPGTQIFGIDIDPNAQSYLNDLFLAGASPYQFINKDFFEVDLKHFNGNLFSAVVGNPPYIRYHDIPEYLQKRAEARLEEFGIRISGRASYWAFFLLYSIQFLKPGGRLAMILPGALLHTDYSSKVREFLVNHFEQINICLLQERIFEGTQEESVIVCAKGAGKPHKEVHVGTASTVQDLAKVLRDLEHQEQSSNLGIGDGEWLRALIDQDTLKIYEEITEDPNVIRLGDWVNTRIGVVTGNNRFFILSPKEREQKGIPESFFVPILRRPAYLRGLTAKNSDFRPLKDQGKEYLLLSPPEKPSKMPKSLQKYIEYGEENGVHLAQKCTVRDPWYIVPQTYVPPAFIACMAASWPRLVVNNSDYTCTNNIIRLIWKVKRPYKDWRKLALGSLSTLSQFSAELVGRSYGGGVLKLEPTELTRLAIPIISDDVVDSLAQKVDLLLRQNNVSAATDAVDSALLDAFTDLSFSHLQQLRSARNKLFLRRRQHRRDANKFV